MQVLILTFLCYMGYHAARKPPSIVKRWVPTWLAQTGHRDGRPGPRPLRPCASRPTRRDPHPNLWRDPTGVACGDAPSPLLLPCCPAPQRAARTAPGRSGVAAVAIDRRQRVGARARGGGGGHRDTAAAALWGRRNAAVRGGGRPSADCGLGAIQSAQRPGMCTLKTRRGGRCPGGGRGGGL